MNVLRPQDARKINSGTHNKTKNYKNTGKIEKLQTELNELRLQDAQKLADMERRITQDVRP
jgi:signal transduction histidine kinase